MKAKVIPLLLLAVILWACNWYEPHEFVRVLVINGTNEPVLVETGLTGMTAQVESGQQQTVSIVKGETVQATGKNTGADYGSRTFYSDGTWAIV